MPELRQNILLKEWVIISTERSKRPDQLREEKSPCEVAYPPYDEQCPFCPGNEEKTGNHVTLDSMEANGAWQIRVIPNKYPALLPPEDGFSVNTTGFFRRMDGIGHHEVLIEHPQHNLTMALFDVNHVYHILRMYQKRMAYLMSFSYVESVILFRNHGSRAGASLVHPHSQIIALPVIPRDVMARMNESIRYHEEHRSCIFCTMMNEELSAGKRIVAESTYFVAFVPYAAFSPFAVWIFPRKHKSSFLYVTEEELADLAVVLRRVLRKLYYGLNDPDYNYIIRSAPQGYSHTAFFHWYLTLVPRLTRSAGFELGSGMFINPSIPEENAAFLRDLVLPEEQTTGS